MIRIATVKATGRKYIVQRTFTPKAGEALRVLCHGEVTNVKVYPQRITLEHEERPVIFLASAVEFSDTTLTVELAQVLINQGCEVANARAKQTRYAVKKTR